MKKNISLRNFKKTKRHNLMKALFFVSSFIFFASCSSTNVSVTDTLKPDGKKVGIATLEIVERKKGNNFKSDSVCTCIAQSINHALIPYLQQAGFTVFNLNANERTPDSLITLISSLNLDYTVTGTGIVHSLGKSTFVDQLSVQLQSLKTGEVIASASFSGTSIRPARAAQKIGEGLVKKIK